MFTPRHGWLLAPFLAAALLASCGAMTIEPATPDEPAVARPHAPRLVRRDAGIDIASDDEQP